MYCIFAKICIVLYAIVFVLGGRRNEEGGGKREGMTFQKFAKPTYDYRREGLKFERFTYDYRWEASEIIKNVSRRGNEEG